MQIPYGCACCQEPHKQQLLLIFTRAQGFCTTPSISTLHFFTYHLRTGWALCRKHKNAWFERVSPQSQKAILSDYLSMKTLSPTAETW